MSPTATPWKSGGARRWHAACGQQRKRLSIGATGASTAPGGGMAGTILVADDDDTILGLVAYLLEDEGYRVLRASDGAEALACAQREDPDLIVTDIMMPRLTGVELVARLRAMPALSVPVIFMSAVACPVALPPRTAYLAKPFEIAALLDLVVEYVAAP